LYHLKVIGNVPAAKPLLRRAGITEELVDGGVVSLAGADAVAGFIAAAKKTRIWDREPKVRNLP
jgi:catalase